MRKTIILLIILISIFIACKKDTPIVPLTISPSVYMRNDVENRLLTYSYGLDLNAYPYQTFDRFTALHCSDVHQGLLNSDVNLKEFLCFSNGDRVKGRISTLICTGDISNGYAGRDKSKTISEIDYVVQQFTAQDIPILMLVGNHDSNINEANPPDSRDYYLQALSKREQYERIIAPIKDKWSGNIDNNIYYYHDYLSFGIRIICLDFIDYPIEPDPANPLKGKYQINFYFSQKQLEWFYATLLSVPKDYGVIVLVHALPNINIKIGTFTQGTEMLSEVINAYKNGEVYMHDFKFLKYPELSTKLRFDFTHNGKKEFICWLGGHVHSRVVISAEKYADQIVIAAPSLYTSEMDNEIKRYGKFNCILYRLSGTDTQNSFNIVQVDRNERKIFITSYGAYLDINNVFKDRTTVVSY